MKKQWNRGRMGNRDERRGVIEGVLDFLLLVQSRSLPSMVYSLELPLLFGL